MALIGYRGTGKSTVGRLVAKKLAATFLDADLEIEAAAGRTIAEIFAHDGEPAFRELEEKTLDELVRGHPRAVLATGGGAVLREANRRRLREHGTVIWLRASPDELGRRLMADQDAGSIRPALTKAGILAEISHVLARRANLYASCCHAGVDTEGLAPDEVAEKIVSLINALSAEQLD